MENSSRFFKNTDCSFFPCHKGMDHEDFNCLFCYCPLYLREVCPGNPTFITKEDGRIIKRCTDCSFPHKSENYERIMNILRTSKPPVQYEEYHHGDETERNNTQNRLCFSVNTNPLGLCEGAKNAIQRSLNELERYPDQKCTRLREKIAQKIRTDLASSVTHFDGIDESHIVCGNGASELISLFVQAVSPKNALIVSPTFSGYERALKICYSKISRHYLSEENDFTLDGTIFDTLAKEKPDMLFLCSPNNPTGKMVQPALLKKIVEFCEEQGIFFFLDECFIDFTERSNESAAVLVEKNPHLVVLNAFTKIYAMAGIRLGYALTSNQSLLLKVNALRPEWNVSSLAQTAGLAALEETDYVKKTRALIAEERAYLSKELKALGFTVYGGESNFILCRTDGNKTSGGRDFSEKLLEKGISLRKCGDFHGLTEQFYRIAVRTHEENERLIGALHD